MIIDVHQNYWRTTDELTCLCLAAFDGVTAFLNVITVSNSILSKKIGGQDQEKKAVTEAIRIEEILNAEMAAEYDNTGQTPKKLLWCTGCQGCEMFHFLV